jgi:arabinosyltransferase A/arabinosyltransferase B/arabinosyltransferase C
MATYLQGDPMRDAAQLYRWVPITALAAPEPVIAGRSVAGWHADGHARVPGLDPVG